VLRRRSVRVLIALCGVALVTFLGYKVISVNATTVGFAYLLVILIIPPGRNVGLIGDWGLNWGLRCVPCRNLQPLRCHPYARKLFRISFPLNS